MTFLCSLATFCCFFQSILNSLPTVSRLRCSNCLEEEEEGAHLFLAVLCCLLGQQEVVSASAARASGQEPAVALRSLLVPTQLLGRADCPLRLHLLKSLFPFKDTNNFRTHMR